MELIQSLLVQWHERQDQAALARAFRLLRIEWAPAVSGYLRRPVSCLAVEHQLSELLGSLLIADSPGKPPRALAPTGHPSPAAWRRRVVLNALRDRQRREQARQRAVAGAAKEAAGAGEDAARPWPDAEDRVLLREMREAVLRVLPGMEIRSRVVLTLELGADVPLSWHADLARELRVPADEVADRLHTHAADPADVEHKVRVLYGQDPDKARDAYRKLLSRAVSELKARLDRGQP